MSGTMEAPPGEAAAETPALIERIDAEGRPYMGFPDVPADGTVIEITPRAVPGETPGLGTGAGGGVGAGEGEGVSTALPEPPPPVPYEERLAERQAVGAVAQARQRQASRQRVQMAAAAPAPAVEPEPPGGRAEAAQGYAAERVARLGLPEGAAGGEGAGAPADPAQRAPREQRRTSETQSTARTVARHVAEGITAIPRGVVGAFASAFEAGDDLADWLNARVPLSGVAAGDPGTPGRTIGRAIRVLQPGREPETVTGQITEEITQFITGFLRGQAALRSRGVLQGGGAGRAAGRAAVAGAIADAFYNEATEKNLFDLWRRVGLPGNPLVEFLETAQEDEAALNRLRNAVAGVVVGGALDGLLALARAARTGRQARTAAQAAGAPPPLPEPATLAEAAGIPARPERDLMIVGDPGRPLVEVRARPVGDPGARLAEASAATSDAAMGVGSDVAARALVGAAEAQRRLAAFRPPVWLAGEAADGPAPAPLADLPDAVRDLILAMRRGRVGPRGEVSLTAFIRAHGGIQDTGGDILAGLGGTHRTAPTLIRRDGMRQERAMQNAIEQGYLPSSASLNDFLQMVVEDATGRVRHYGTTLDADGRALAAAADDLDAVLSAHGLRADSPMEEIAAAIGREPDGAARSADDLAQEDAARERPGPAEPLPLVENTAATRSATDPGAVFINWGRIQTGEDVQAVIRDMAEGFRGDVNAARRGVQSNEETARLAEMLNLTPDELLARQRGEVLNAETALAARQLYTASGERLLEAARMAAAPGAGALEQAAFRRMMAIHYAIQAQVLGARAEAGRALQAWAIPAASGGRQMRMIEDLLEGTGGVEVSRAMAARLAILGNNVAPNALPGVLSGFVNRGWGGRTIEAVQQFWMNALLSSPATHAANIIGNGLNMPLMLMEREGAAQIGRLTGSADAVLPGETGAMLYGLMTGFRDALRMGALTYRDDGQAIAAMIGRQDLPRQGAISSAAWGVDAGSGVGRALDFVGHQVVSAPGRAMGAEDAFFKSAIYRMELHAQALRQAVREAPRRPDGSADPAAVGALMAQIMRDPPESVARAAADEALYRTFNRQAGPIAQRLLLLRNSDSPGWNLAMSVVLPFVRTPMNLFSYGLERTPMAPLVGQWRADIAAGGARRDAALARMAVGSMVLAHTFQLAEQGVVNGYGPSDPRERETWTRAGNQPYSLRIGDVWVPFNRLDPYGFLLGFAADMRELMERRDLGEREEVETRRLIAAMAMTFSNAIGERTVFRGVTAVAEALDRRQPDAERFIGQTAASFAVPGIVSAAGQAVDQAQYDRGQGWIAGRLAGLSSADMIPRRNLWGEPMMRPGVETLGPVGAALSPVKPTRVGGRPIDVEMRRLNMGLQAIDQNGTVIFGAGAPVNVRNINPQALDQLRRWAGNELPLPAFGNLGLADALDEMVQGRGPYGAAFLRASDDGKERAIRMTATRFREAARDALLADPRFADVAAVAGGRREEAAEGRGEVPIPRSRAAAQRAPGEIPPPPRQRARSSEQPAMR